MNIKRRFWKSLKNGVWKKNNKRDDKKFEKQLEKRMSYKKSFRSTQH